MDRDGSRPSGAARAAGAASGSVRPLLWLLLPAFLLAPLSGAGVEMVSSGDGGCRFTAEFSEPSVVSDGGHFRLAFDGAATSCVPGEPMIPVVRVFVPVPAGASPAIRYSAREAGRLVLPDLPVMRAPDLEGTGLETVEVPSLPLPGPGEAVSVSSPFPLAGYTFVVVEIRPWLPSDGGSWIRSLEISLEWEPARGGATPTGPAARVALEGCRAWPLPGTDGREGVFWGSPWARIATGDTGGYEVSCSDLESAGCEIAGAPSASLRLFSGPGLQFDDDPADGHELAEVAFEVLDGGDGSFDPEDRIRFLGQGLGRWLPYGGDNFRIRHRFSLHNVYWLTWGGEDGRRWPSLEAAPDGSPQWGPTVEADLWLEESHAWNTSFETVTGWTWASLDPGTQYETAFTLPTPVAGAGTLEVALISEDSGSNTVEILIDGSKVGEETWSGAGEHVVNIEGVSPPQAGEITLANSASSANTLLLDWIHVSYQMPLSSSAGIELRPGTGGEGRYGFVLGGLDPDADVLDFTDPFTPCRLSGVSQSGSSAQFSFEVSEDSRIIAMPSSGWMEADSITPAQPGRLLGTVTGADILIVTSEELRDAVWGLSAIYEARGLTCEVATTREIYDEFGQGVTDPGAIRSAIRWAMDSWTPAAQGVVLVGDGHFDILGYATTRAVQVPPWSLLGPGDYCSDDCYAMVHEGSVLPELPLSRIPVDSRAELLTYLEKLAICESGTNSGAWLNRAMLIADDEWGEYSQNETEHTTNCEEMADSVLSTLYDRRKFYLIEYPWPTSETHPEKPEAREDLVSALSEGQGLVIYFGHGSAGQLAHEKVFLRGDVGRLLNGDRLPMYFFGTCDLGHFDGLGEDAIAELLLTHPAGGAVSCVAATRGTYGVSNLGLCGAMIDSLQSDPALTAGEALWLAKLAEPAYDTNNRFYVLFGDLGAGLYRPSESFQLVVADDTLRTGETNQISGSALPDAEGLAFVEARESSQLVVYNCLGGAVIEWLRYGGTAFRGTAAVEAGEFTLPCFVPIQSVVGPQGRTQASAPSSSFLSAAAIDPVPLVEGEPSGNDYEGPEAALWIAGYEGIDNPVVSGQLQFEADLSDTSGICFLGGQGRQLTLFVDGQGADVGAWFSYLQGSTTRGHLSHSLGQLSEGFHDLILWSFDGVGNSSLDTLTVEARSPDKLTLSEVLVYPNPGSGRRCFSFLLSEDASVTIGIYTVNGACIERLSADCGQGYNQVLWDGLDADGDRPASGAYIYRIEAVSAGTSVFDNTAVADGIIAEIREE